MWPTMPNSSNTSRIESRAWATADSAGIDRPSGQAFFAGRKRSDAEFMQ